MNLPPINLDLSTIEQEQLNAALSDIADALDGISIEHLSELVYLIPAVAFDELRAYLGTIRDAQYRLTQLFYNTAVREPDPQPNVVAVSFDGRPQDGKVYYDTDWIKLAHQYRRGVITSNEFEASAAVYWGERGLSDADNLFRIDWLYEHEAIDRTLWLDLLGEHWSEHIQTVIADQDEDHSCEMCVFDDGREWALDHANVFDVRVSQQRHPSSGVSS